MARIGAKLLRTFEGGILALMLGHAMVPFAAAQQQTLPKASEYRAKLTPSREVEVATSHDGLLLKINFTAGQLVKQGDLLFEFDARDKELTLALAKSLLTQAEAAERLSLAKLQNAETLSSRNIATRMQLLEAQAQRDLAAAKLDETRANLGLANLALEQTKLYAPIGGIIGGALVHEGTYITKAARHQSRLATIMQVDPIRAIGQAPAAMYFQRNALNSGRGEGAEDVVFTLVLPTGERYPHTGRIIGGQYEFDVATQTVEVSVEFPNPDLLLRPGLQVILQSSIRAK